MKSAKTVRGIFEIFWLNFVVWLFSETVSQQAGGAEGSLRGTRRESRCETAVPVAYREKCVNRAHDQARGVEISLRDTRSRLRYQTAMAVAHPVAHTSRAQDLACVTLLTLLVTLTLCVFILPCSWPVSRAQFRLCHHALDGVPCLLVMPVSQRLECGSHAAAAAMLTIWRVSRR